MRRQSPAESEQHSLGMLLKRAEQAMVRSKNAALKPVGISLAQYVALDQLERQSGITAAGLARACFVSAQAMMVLLKTSEQQGLVSRTAHPRHPNVLELRLTEVGREALQAARAGLEPIEAHVMAGFDVAELRAFRDYLGRFVQRFGAD